MSKIKRLLIIVDFQEDFIQGSLGFDGALGIEKRLLALIAEFQNREDDIVFTKDLHGGDYLKTEEGKNLPIPHCLINTKGSNIYGEVGKLSNNYLIFEKETFGSKKLFEFLLQCDYQEVVLAGLVSTICVLSNAVLVKTALPNAHVIIDRQGSSSPNKQLEEKAYEVLQNIHVEIK